MMTSTVVFPLTKNAKMNPVRNASTVALTMSPLPRIGRYATRSMATAAPPANTIATVATKASTPTNANRS